MAITIATGDTIAGATTTASTLTCSIFGDAVTSSGDAYQCLYQGQLATSAATIYTSAASTSTVISAIYLYNSSSSTAQTVTLFRGGTAASNQIVQIVVAPLGFASYENGYGWQNGPGVPGVLLARAAFAPSTVTTYTLVAVATGLTALDSTNLKVVFIAPPSGNVMVELQGFCKGGAGAATSVIFGITSTTASPGTVVGVTGLVWLSPTATAADNGTLANMTQLITGLTPGASLTWYFAATDSGTAATILAQGPTVATTVPTGAPAVIAVYAA
jgi:hypothetical protein